MQPDTALAAPHQRGLSILDVVQVAGVGRSTVFSEIAAGRLRARKCGRRTIILERDLEAWLEGPPAVDPGQRIAGGERRSTAPAPAGKRRP